jgi:DNA-binding transcriptional LysR family regulator
MVLAIAEAGSVTKAAATLGLAQPALTTQLQRIERILGGALFLRDRRGVLPTPLGDLVLARARVLIPAVSGLHDDASELITAGAEGLYRIGATNGPILAGLVRRLSEAHPGGPVSVHSHWSANEIAQMVADGRLDFAVVGACANYTPGNANGLIWHPITLDAVWVLMHDKHPLAGRVEVGLADLEGERWIGAPGDGCFHECFAAACARVGFAPELPMEINASSVFDLVVAGDAVALCQGIVREVPGAVAVPLAGVPLRWRHLLAWDPQAPAARHADEMFRSAVDSYLEILAQRPRYARWLAGHPGLGVQRVVPLVPPGMPGRPGLIGRSDPMIA